MYFGISNECTKYLVGIWIIESLEDNHFPYIKCKWK